MSSNVRKKWMFLLLSALTFSLIFVPTTRAQGNDSQLLQQIANNTLNTANFSKNILQNLNNLPTYLQNIGKFILAWMSKDDSEQTSTIQAGFTELGNLLNKNLDGQLNMQQQLNIDLFQGEANQGNLPNANDLVYSSLLGKPFFPKDPRNKGKTSVNYQYNYIKNAAGLGLTHEIPNAGWQGSEIDQKIYEHYFNTVASVESFNSFVLSNQYIDGSQLNTLQKKLITQATDPKNWFAKVASENIGFVLRQILLYQSQVFVLMTQMIQVEKQMVTAQAMTNTMLIANNIMNESILSQRAQSTSLG